VALSLRRVGEYFQTYAELKTTVSMEEEEEG
jgi:hypothetical protein